MPPEVQQHAEPTIKCGGAAQLENGHPIFGAKMRLATSSWCTAFLCKPSTLAKWFCINSNGPPALKCGRVPLYPRDALDAWAVRRLGPLRRSTSDVGTISEGNQAAPIACDRDAASLRAPDTS